VTEQPLNLRTSLQEIRRRRLLIIVVAALCGIAGLAYGLFSPAKEGAVALVLLPSSTAPASGNSGNTGNTGSAQAGNSIDTNAVIAKSTPVLAAAGAKVSPPLGASEVKKLVTVTPLSGQILQIQAQDRESTYAVQLANAVAASYVAYIGHLQGSSAQAAVTALQRESTLLTKQINDLQSQIDTVTSRVAAEGAGSSAGQQDTDLLGSLRSEQNQVSLQLNRVTGQITNAQLANGSAVNTTRILQKAATQPASKYKLPIEFGIIGILIGLLGSTAFVLMRLQGGRRLRLRDEIARVAGAPVIGSVESPRCVTPSEWRALLEERPRATDQWALRHILRSIPTGGGRPQTVRVISFAGDSSAVTTGPRLALHAAGSGTPTVLLPDDPIGPGGTSLAPLRAAFTGAQPVGRGLPITMGLGDTDETPSTLLFTVVVFDGTSANLTSFDAVNLLSISSNFVTADELAQLALTAADSGFALDGVVVVNPDQTDNTTGSMRDETVRLLPPPARADAGSDEEVHFGARTSHAGSSPGRLTRQQH
jgi:capsular polysaccharide biosynthesis protein